MAWKIERMKDIPFMRDRGEYERYQTLTPRELSVLTCAILDIDLAELISRRLTGPEKEIIDFLGADDNAKAPLKNFGSRIQLARLIGIIGDEEAQALRDLKDIRNKLAHRVNVSLIDEKPFARIESLYRFYRWYLEIGKQDLSKLGTLERTDKDAFTVLFIVTASLHGFFGLLYEKIVPIQPASDDYQVRQLQEAFQQAFRRS